MKIFFLEKFEKNFLNHSVDFFFDNCEKWILLKKNIRVPLLYDTLEETINVMGHLFGRDAAIEILKNKRTMWWMSLGITWDNKESISKILKK